MTCAPSDYVGSEYLVPIVSGNDVVGTCAKLFVCKFADYSGEEYVKVPSIVRGIGDVKLCRNCTSSTSTHDIVVRTGESVVSITVDAGTDKLVRAMSIGKCGKSWAAFSGERI